MLIEIIVVFFKKKVEIQNLSKHNKFFPNLKGPIPIPKLVITNTAGQSTYDRLYYKTCHILSTELTLLSKNSFLVRDYFWSCDSLEPVYIHVELNFVFVWIHICVFSKVHANILH